MSSRREVFIRVLALLQRTTLIETKNRTLKCLKRHCSTVRSMKNVAVLQIHPGAFDSSGVPIPGNLPSKAKKMLMPEGDWAQLELTDAKVLCLDLLLMFALCKGAS